MSGYRLIVPPYWAWRSAGGPLGIARYVGAGPAACLVPALSIEVDHELDEDGSRPAGRVWLVRMRRSRREVVVASDLGRPSAGHLADLIGPLRRAQGGAME